MQDKAKQIPPPVPGELPSDFRAMLRNTVTHSGHRTAFLIPENKKLTILTWQAFYKEVAALGTALIDMGLAGCPVALCAENRYAWALAYLAVTCIGSVVVPLDKELPGSDIVNLLTRSDACALFESAKVAVKVDEAHTLPSALRHRISFDAACGTGGLRDLLRIGHDLLATGDTRFEESSIRPDAPGILLFTSGTTGNAKGVVLSQKNIIFDIASVISTVDITCEDRALSILPLHHTYECTCGFLAFVYLGASIGYAEGLRHISRNLKEVCPTVLVLVPLLAEGLYQKIWDTAKKENRTGTLKKALKLSGFLGRFGIDVRRRLFSAVHAAFGGKLRLMLVGAAAMNPEISADLRRLGVDVLQGYGLTECSPLVTGNRSAFYKDASAGLPLPGVEVRIQDANDDGIGELQVRGPNVMLGYYHDEESTNSIFEDGWFRTGDLGYKDKDGFFYLTGRSKNVIVTKTGKNIYPEELEARLNAAFGVAESLVWGKEDKSSGDTIVSASILPDFEGIRQKLHLPELPTTDDIRHVIEEAVRAVNQNLPSYKRIRDFTVRESEFIKTTTQKIKRFVEHNRS